MDFVFINTYNFNYFSLLFCIYILYIIALFVYLWNDLEKLGKALKGIVHLK